MQNGWIKLHRKTQTNKIWLYDPTAWRIFEYLMFNCNSDGEWSGGRKTIAAYLGINENTIYSALKRLKKAKMVNTSSNNQYTIYNILNWSKYQQPSTAPATTNQQPINTIVRIENKNINTTNVVFGKPEINEVFSYWQETTGLEILSRVQANRNAASNLVKKHGADKVRQLIDGVALAQNDQYAPRISDFCDLQTKLNQLIVWGRQQSKSKGVKIS